MHSSTGKLFLAFMGVLCLLTPLAAADMTIHGTVTDNNGKPIRGAMIKVTTGARLVARFTQKNGTYEITVHPGTYDVVVDAYGFGTKRVTKDQSQMGDTNFSLSPKFDVARLTSAEVEQLLPDNADTRLLENECIRCHALTYPARRAGMTASEWAAFIPTMTRGRYFNDPTFSGDRLAALSKDLERYFGPDSLYFGPDAEPPKPEQIKHVEPTDNVLKATIREYRTPTRDPFAHSITVDQNGNAWFSELGQHGNKIDRFNLETEEFQEYPIPSPDFGPHTGAVDKNGVLWVTLVGGLPGIGDGKAQSAKLASIDTKTGVLKTYGFPGYKPGTHTLAIDQDGNVWCSGSTLLKFDVKTGQFKEYKLPVPSGTDYSENTWAGWHNLPGKPRLPNDQYLYDVRVDSKGMVWSSVSSIALLIRLDPKTGETKTFAPPDSVSIKGIEVDKDDNVWFAVFWGSGLGKFDQKTEKFTIYRSPTPNFMPYGLTADKKTGDIWYADLNGNYITRFDPKTQVFDQYPIPSAQASARFPGFDLERGRVWFTEFMNDKIGVIELNGNSTKHASN